MRARRDSTSARDSCRVLPLVLSKMFTAVLIAADLIFCVHVAQVAGSGPQAAYRRPHRDMTLNSRPLEE